MRQTLFEIYDYRQMVVGLVQRELRGRYKGSILGFLWTFINPLLQLCVYTLVFGTLFNQRMPKFYLYVFVGLIPWLFFSACLTKGSGAVLDQSRLVTKIYFPREVLPISFVTSQFVNMLYCFVIVIGVYLFSSFVATNNPWVWQIPSASFFLPLISLPLLFVIEYFICLGMVLFTSAVTVYVRDIKNILTILGTLWMFSTPIMWQLSGDRFIKYEWLFMYVNPMGGLIDSYHKILYSGVWPNFIYIGVAACWALLAMVVGSLVFAKAKKRFAEEM